MILRTSLVALAVTLTLPAAVFAQNNEAETQTSPEVIDEVIAYGRRGQSGNRAMRAFNAGDFETAEIEFENHFKSLKRADRAVKRAVRVTSDAAITSELVAGLPQASVSGGGGAANPAPVVSVNSASTSNAASSSNMQGITSLNADGKITYEDFAFSRYMSGLTQIQLEKYSEAKVSFTESLDHNYRNYDARMRLGLLELRDGNFEVAAKHLQKLDKQRKNCGDRCKDSEALEEATLTLAKALGSKQL